jgi:hypothetical protein
MELYDMEIPRRLVHNFWSKMEARDWSGLASLLGEGFLAQYPQSGERFDRDSFVAVNRMYPGTWSIISSEVIAAETGFLSITKVEIDGRIDHALTLFDVQDGRIWGIREYWAEPFLPPDWRVNLFSSNTTSD